MLGSAQHTDTSLTGGCQVVGRRSWLENGMEEAWG